MTSTTMNKMHVGLNTNRFGDSVEFYQKFFDRAPVKLKKGYAKFELDNPGLNFTLYETATPPKEPSTLNHLGIQVSTSEEVMQALERLSEKGFDTLEEKDTTCCYALQDKVWVTDPNGYRWEVFVVKVGDVTSDADTASPAVSATAGSAAASAAGEEACCAPTCCS